MSVESIRFSLVKEFLSENLIHEHSITQLKGDAGQRRYYRINSSCVSYILMDCHLIPNVIDPFISISHFLRHNNFTAPQILFYDRENHLLIIDDFGDVNIKDYIINAYDINLFKKKSRDEIYQLLIDLLINIQKVGYPDGLSFYNSQKMLDELKLFLEWYVPYRNISLNRRQISDFNDIWLDIFETLDQNKLPNTIILRDYHVENLMYVEKFSNIQSIGILDFQDALYGSPVYDLVSILEDARITVDVNFAQSCVEYYTKIMCFDINKVMLHYHILGAQRNIRILGVFVRKFLRDNDNRYLSYIDLVVSYLRHNLLYPKLYALKNWFDQNIF